MIRRGICRRVYGSATPRSNNTDLTGWQVHEAQNWRKGFTQCSRTFRGLIRIKRLSCDKQLCKKQVIAKGDGQRRRRRLDLGASL